MLNDFSDTLAGAAFQYKDTYGVSREKYAEYLEVIKRDEFVESEFLTTKFSDFRYRIHAECYSVAKAKPEAAEFIEWLKANDWKVVICTKRNLRLAGDCTKKWLQDNSIPYDYIAMAVNKIVFCKLWNIEYLIDDDILNITHGEQFGVKVFYPVMAKHSMAFPQSAQGFTSFEEIKQWIK